MYLKEKSEFNIASAEILYTQNYYAPSVHCAYYACFQLMKHIISERFHISYEEQEAETRASNNPNTHSYVIGKIRNEIRSDRERFREINYQLGDLRNFRNKADYDNIQIDSELSDKAIRFSKNLLGYLTEKLL